MRHLLTTIATYCSVSLVPLLLVGSFGCSAGESEGTNGTGSVATESDTASTPYLGSEEFVSYWYAGVAELGRYELEQARYGEMHQGDAVLIFVTEDFLADAQVKLESEPAGRPAPSVLKLNMTKTFLTGVYPYSMMMSVFTPVDRASWPATLKVTTSSQEWCGHTFTQLNRLADAWRVRQFSYFEKEGDVDREVEADFLEDEVWTRLRIDPASLPLGEVTVLPGTLTARLRHTEHTPVAAEARRLEIPESEEWGEMERYMLEYANPPRTLMIDYQKSFPHRIISWSETYNDFGTVSTTTARLADTLRLDYWSRHDVADSVWRKKLGY